MCGFLRDQLCDRTRAFEWPALREAFVKHHAEGVQITARINGARIAAELLGRSVGKRAEELACDRRVVRGAARFALFRAARESEIENARDTILVHENVARLEVAMNHAATMRIRDGIGDLMKERDHRAGGQRVVRDESVEPLTLDILHGKPRLIPA